MSISLGTATEKLAAGMLPLGVPGVSGSRGTPMEGPEMVVCGGWLGCLSSAPAIPWRALFVAPSQLVMSVLKTLLHFSKHFEPVLICPVTSVSPQAPHAEQDFSAASLLTMFDRLFVAC